jgi:S1-C subfamily serine protease
MSLANQILAGQASATVLLGYPGQLGVVMSEPALATVPGGAAQGVTVAEVMPGSPAASAGVKAGDVLTEVDGQPATTPDQVSGLIKKHRAGEKLSFTWIDETGRRRTSTVVLAPGPAD